MTGRKTPAVAKAISILQVPECSMNLLVLYLNGTVLQPVLGKVQGEMQRQG